MFGNNRPTIPLSPEMRERFERILGFDDVAKTRWFETNAKYYERGITVETGWDSKLLMHLFPAKSAGVYVMPSYQSPVSGKWIDSPGQRRNDLASTNSRPWEGMAAEKKESERRAQYDETRLDKKLDADITQAIQQLPEATRRTILT